MLSKRLLFSRPFRKQIAPSCKQFHQGASSSSALFLHVGPSGDCWTGPSLFAAKHLQPDYVQSLPIPSSHLHQADRLLELLEEHPEWALAVYDTQAFPKELQAALKEQDEE